jgi:hypothetical protein
MRTVVKTQQNVLELNYMWLPTWVGINTVLKQELEDALKDKIVGRPMTEEVLDEIDGMIFDFLEARAPHVEGLRDYLDGLKFVNITAKG